MCVCVCMCISPEHVRNTDRRSGIGNGFPSELVDCWYHLLPWGTGLEGGVVIL